MSDYPQFRGVAAPNFSESISALNSAGSLFSKAMQGLHGVVDESVDFHTGNALNDLRQAEGIEALKEARKNIGPWVDHTAFDKEADAMEQNFLLAAEREAEAEQRLFTNNLRTEEAARQQAQAERAASEHAYRVQERALDEEAKNFTNRVDAERSNLFASSLDKALEGTDYDQTTIDTITTAADASVGSDGQFSKELFATNYTKGAEDSLNKAAIQYDLAKTALNKDKTNPLALAAYNEANNNLIAQQKELQITKGMAAKVGAAIKQNHLKSSTAFADKYKADYDRYGSRLNKAYGATAQQKQASADILQQEAKANQAYEKLQPISGTVEEYVDASFRDRSWTNSNRNNVVTAAETLQNDTDGHLTEAISSLGLSPEVTQQLVTKFAYQGLPKIVIDAMGTDANDNSVYTDTGETRDAGIKVLKDLIKSIGPNALLTPDRNSININP